MLGCQPGTVGCRLGSLHVMAGGAERAAFPWLPQVPWIDSISLGRHMYAKFRNLLLVYFAPGESSVDCGLDVQELSIIVPPTLRPVRAWGERGSAGCLLCATAWLGSNAAGWRQAPPPAAHLPCARHGMLAAQRLRK